MTSFKPLRTIAEPESRSPLLGRTIAAHHERVSALQVALSVPRDITLHFDVARNLLLYAWFVYEFIPVAELHAYSSVEFALREKIRPRRTRAGLPGFKVLMARAVAQGWVTDQGFEHFRRLEQQREEFRQIWAQIPGYANSAPEQQQLESYASMLVDNMPYFRNVLAHGSSYISPHGYFTLELCRDIINQLFPGEKLVGGCIHVGRRCGLTTRWSRPGSGARKWRRG